MWSLPNPLLVPHNYKISSPNIKKDILTGTQVAAVVVNILLGYTWSPHSAKSQKATGREQQNIHTTNQEGICASKITTICQINIPRCQHGITISNSQETLPLLKVTIPITIRFGYYNNADTQKKSLIVAFVNIITVLLEEMNKFTKEIYENTKSRKE